MKRTTLLPFLLLFYLNIYAQGDGQYHQFKLNIDGLNREYWLYVPSGHVESEEWPVVFMFHGLGVSLDAQNQISQWYNVADTAKFLIAWPVGLEVHDLIFNITNPGWLIPGLTEATKGQNDLAFVDKIIDDLDTNPAYAIDNTRIYAAGFSSGADMAFYLACAFSDRITAVAGVGGQMTYDQVSQENNYCNPARPISVLQILGTEDPYYPIDGTEDFLPLFGTSKFWADNNNCDTMPQSSNIANTNTNDNSTVTLFVYDGCEDDYEVYFYRVNGGGHTWPGGTGGDGVINFDIHASVEIWNFFNRHSSNTNHPGASYCGPYTLSEPISYNGVMDMTISELEISNPDGNCISLSNCHNIIIEKCKLGSSIGNGIELYNCSNITIVDCRMDSIATGVYANECQGVNVTNIEVTNVQGPSPRGQMVQFNNVN